MYAKRKYTPRNPVQIIDAEFGQIALTKLQIQILVDTTNSVSREGCYGSSCTKLSNNIRLMTGWHQRGIALFCRFAYHFGLAKL